ncbi:sigma 54-interacting transcriptional regulator [bacterium]|nr:sigma 54-interacting transcriptional regulator [bacterium]
MVLNENEFFREATLRICGSIEIEEALSNCFDYLRQFIKADVMHLHYINPQERTGTLFAMADKNGGKRLNIRFGKQSPVWTYLDDGKQFPEKLMINRADQHPAGRMMLKIINKKGKYSTIMMRLSIKNREIGVVSFEAKGWDRFKEKDFKLLRLLQLPIAIALSNSRRYLELMALKNQLIDDKKYLQNELQKQQDMKIVGSENGLAGVLQQIRLVSPLDSPVLLYGETGVGKEIMANAIHILSNRREGPFIKVNCGAIPESLIDSELFGHVKGAFTGALENKRGRFERSHGGTIFLDEVGELPLAAQTRFLRVLQEKEFEPVGGTKSVKVDIRVIAATNRNLESLINEGGFRKDLYFRLNVFPVSIPPLRERKDDIPALVQHFIQMKYRKMGIKEFPELANGATKQLKSYDWPGNVRELENVVEKAMILFREGPLRFEDLKMPIEDVRIETHQNFDSASHLLDEVVEKHIRQILNITRGKINGPGGASELLGVHPSTLRHKLRKMGINFGKKGRILPAP